MDPTALATIAVTALAPLGVEAAKEVAKTAGKDVYAKLKTFLEGRFKGKPKAQQALANYEQKPELHKEALTEVLCEEIKSDPAFAQELQALLQVGEDSGDMQVAVQVQDQGKAVIAKQVIGDINM